MSDQKEQIDIYYDHYKDTMENLKGHIVKRDKITLGIIALLAIVLLIVSNALDFTQQVNRLLSNEFSISPFSLQTINTACVFLLLFVSLQYYQICLHIERTYVYIENLEYQLSIMTELNIDRESGHYLHNYPFVSNIAHFIYTYIFPIAITTVSIIKLLQEFNLFDGLFLIIDSIILIVIISVSLVYVTDRILLNYRSSWSEVWGAIKGGLLNFLGWGKSQFDETNRCRNCLIIFVLLSIAVICVIIFYNR